MPNQSSEGLHEEILRRLKLDNPTVQGSILHTLALLVTGVLLSHNVQLYMIALWLPFMVQQTSLIRRFEGWLANPKVDVKQLFAPFILATHRTLQSDQAYVVLDCTQAGRKCRTLMAGLVYQHTVIPLSWKTIKGKKGHVKGKLQKEVLSELYQQLGQYRRVVVLGDAEFSNETVISWFQDKRCWFFVFRFQNSYLLKCADDPRWLSAGEWRTEAQLTKGQVCHFEGVTFTDKHKLADLTMTIHWDDQEPEPLFLISNLSPLDDPHLLYEMRFWIETLFGNFKSRGFHLDQTRLTQPEQIDRLILVIAIATCIALHIGTEICLTGEQKLVDRSDRRDLSLFQIGIRAIARLLVEKRFILNSIYFDWSLQLPPPGFQKP